MSRKTAVEAPPTITTVVTVAAMTLREAARRRVLLALAALTVVLLALSGWGFARLAAESDTLTSGEARLTASIVLNLVMFGYSLIAALGTAFLAGPTLAGETDSGIALAVLARPIHRRDYLLGKWLGLAAFGTAFIVGAGVVQCVVVQQTTGYWPPRPGFALAHLAIQTIVLLTLAVLLSTVISPMASGVVTVGVFGATWIAGVVGGIGESLGNAGVARVGTISRVLVPTDGLWRGAMHAFQDPGALLQFGGADASAFPFLGAAPLTGAYFVWVAIWVVMVWTLAVAAFARSDL